MTSIALAACVWALMAAMVITALGKDDETDEDRACTWFVGLCWPVALAIKVILDVRAAKAKEKKS